MKQAELLRILQILSKYTEEEDELNCDAYSIYMSPDRKDLDPKDVEELAGLGAKWSEEDDCWEVFF